MIGFSSSFKSSSGADSSPELPSPPWVKVDGINNFRDIGGYALANNEHRSVRRNYCYRCADPARVSAAGKATITNLGITTIFDLRSTPEVAKNAVGNWQKNNSNKNNNLEPIEANDKNHESTSADSSSPFDNLPNVTRYHTPVFVDRDFSPEGMARGYANYTRGGPEGFKAAYTQILNSGPPAITTVLKHVRDRPLEPFVMHCSAGKDRTGVIAAILLTIAGADEEAIATEYELTEIGLEPMKPFVVAHLMKEPLLQGNPEGVERMVSAKKENMLAFLEMLQEKYDGAAGYLKNQCGFTDEDITIIRKNLTDDTSPVLGSYK